MIIDQLAVVGNNTVICITLTQFPPKIISYKTIVENHNQDIGINTVGI